MIVEVETPPLLFTSFFFLKQRLFFLSIFWSLNAKAQSSRSYFGGYLCFTADLTILKSSIS